MNKLAPLWMVVALGIVILVAGVVTKILAIMVTGALIAIGVGAMALAMRPRGEP
jgi:hypothetical protein